MRKYLLLSILSIWSAQLLAASTTSVRIRTDYDLVVSGTTTSTFEIGSSSSSDGSSESSPARVYIPMDGPLAGAFDEARYFTVKGVTTLFNATGTYTVSFPLYVNSTSNDYYLYMAVRVPGSTTSLKVVGSSLATKFNNSTNEDYNLVISTKEICDQVGDCTSFATGTTEKTYMSYFFLSTVAPASATLAVGATMAIADYPNGMYYEVNMSNRVYSAANLTMNISEIRPGDRRVNIKYTSSASILKPKAIRLYNHGGTQAGVSANQPIQDYFASGGDLLVKEFTYTDSGEITLTDLINGTTAYYSILGVDRYKFGTVLSDDLEGSSKSIEELLKANNCFLLTAGFGEDHFVIDYFRHFRDNVLVNTFLGRQFIHFYYELAPKYALLLYKSETLRATMRGIGYALYFIFNYYLILLAGALVSSYGIYLLKKREKIKT